MKNRMQRWIGLLGVACAAAHLLAADPARLASDPAVERALAFARENEPNVIEHQIRLTEIPAPPFAEARRAQAYKALFEERGLVNVRIDQAGNVLGERQGKRQRPHLVFSAHLDTVFPEGTEIKVRREGSLLRAPGIGDDGRGLAVLLGVIEALNAQGIETEGSITFVGTVGEEGLGDLRGVKHLFAEELRDRVDRFVSVDGSGLAIVHAGVGSYRYRVAYQGPGGHSYGSFGMANPIHALGRLIGRVAEFETPADPKTTFSVGRIWGGTSVNSIAHEAGCEVDLRSEDPAALDALDRRFRSAAGEALEAENKRWNGRGRIALNLERVGERPAGRTGAEHPVTRAAVAVTRALGADARLTASSTDANVPMHLGVPALTIGGGGNGAGAHSPGESFDTAYSWLGTQRALLVAIALASEL
jgi:tripeptide aminopeptidase